MKQLITALDDTCRHPRHLCHMDPEAVFTTAGQQLPDKNDLVLDLLYGHMVVPDPGKEFCHFVQFMVMRGKKHLRPE